MLAIDHFLRDLHATDSLPAFKVAAFHDFVLHAINVLDSSPDSFWECCCALKDLANSRAALDYVETELLTSLKTTPFLLQLKLLECDRFTLLLRYQPPKPQAATTLRSSVENRIMAMIKGTARAHRFTQPLMEPFDVFDAGRKIMSLGESSFCPGDLLKCRAGADCFDLCTVRDCMFFDLRSDPVYTVEWLYDSATLAPRRMVFVDPLDMRIDVALLTVQHLRSQESIPFVRPFLEHPNHFIRLSAAKALLHLEPDKARTYLEALGRDPHPQLRAAARQLMPQPQTVST
jgi:hypothetical protein